MPASRRTSIAQLEELVAWMETHPLLARGSQLGLAQAKHKANCLWEELAPRLNAIGDGVSKTAKEWRQYWSDLKCNVKRKGSAMRQHASGTGGGPSWEEGILTLLEDRILSLMGVQNVMGNANVRIEVDIGLDDSPSPPVLLLTHPQLSPLPSTSGRPPTPTFDALEASPSNADLLQASPQQSRQPKRKHVPGPEVGKSMPNTGPPRWAWELEERRVQEERLRRELVERRVAQKDEQLQLERRRLQLLERQVQQGDQLLQREERRIEADRTFQRDLLAALGQLSRALGLPLPLRPTSTASPQSPPSSP